MPRPEEDAPPARGRAGGLDRTLLLLRGLPEADDVAVGIGREREPSRSGHFRLLLHLLAAVARDPGEDRLDLVDEDVVQDLPGHARRGVPEPAADPAFPRLVKRVLHLGHFGELPAEDLTVESL